MAPIRIAAPSARTAFVLVDALAEFRATAVHETLGWQVVIPRRFVTRDAIPQALSQTRRWLAECDLVATSVSMNGESHVLQREGATLTPVR